MEKSEEYIARLEKEGFTEVYEWFDAPGAIYSEHSHNGAVSLMIVEGSITFTLPDKKVDLHANDRLDVPVGIPHSAVVGSEGCKYVVGQTDPDDK